MQFLSKGEVLAALNDLSLVHNSTSTQTAFAFPHEINSNMELDYNTNINVKITKTPPVATVWGLLTN